MKLELSTEEVEALERALGIYLGELEMVLARTEKHELQASLHHTSRLLERIHRRLRTDNTVARPNLPA